MLARAVSLQDLPSCAHARDEGSAHVVIGMVGTLLVYTRVEFEKGWEKLEKGVYVDTNFVKYMQDEA